MNTPIPCNTCINLYFDCMCEDDPTYCAECKLNLTLGDKKCKNYKKFMIKKRNEYEQNPV